MGFLVYDSSPVVAVPTAENAWGALTDIYIPKIPWRGFKVLSQQQSGSYTTTIQLYLDGAAFGPLLASDGAPDQSWEYYMPFNVAPGAQLAAECWYNTTSPPNCNIQLIGLSEPEFPGIMGCESFGISPGTANVTCTASAWTQIGGILPSLPIKRIRINAQQPAAAQGQTFNFGIGPTSTSIVTLLSNLPYGNADSYYGWVSHRFKTDFPGSGNYLWIYNNGGTLGANIFAYY